MAKKKKAAAPKPMSKADLVDALAEGTELSKKEVTSVLDQLEEVIQDQLGKDGPGVFNIPGLLKISRQWKEKTEPREGINPFTKEKQTFPGKPAHYVVKVKPLKGLSDMVDGLKQQ